MIRSQLAFFKVASPKFFVDITYTQTAWYLLENTGITHRVNFIMINYYSFRDRNGYHATTTSQWFNLLIELQALFSKFHKIYQRNFKVSWNFCIRAIIYA